MEILRDFILRSLIIRLFPNKPKRFLIMRNKQDFQTPNKKEEDLCDACFKSINLRLYIRVTSDLYLSVYILSLINFVKFSTKLIYLS